MTRSLQFKWLAFILVDVALAIVLVMLWLGRTELELRQQLDELGVVPYPEARPLPDFSLIDQNGTPFNRDDLDGKWSLVFFGFSHCPNVCPLTMAELGQFYTRLLETGETELPQVIMATVDPARDDPNRLTEYLSRYHQDFVGLTGSQEELAQLADQLYVVATATEDADSPGASHHELASNSHNELPAFNHSGHISVINPQGELVAALRLPHRDELLIEAYRRLID